VSVPRLERLPAAARSAAVLAGYLLLALLVFLPVGPLDASRLPDGGLGDPAQMTWFLAYTAHALSHGHDLFQTTALGYPGGVNLASNTTVPLLGVLSTPVVLALGPVAAFNLLLHLALALSAFSLYAVLGRLGTARPARALGGLLYGFGPYLVGQARGDAHLDLAFGVLPPVLFLLAYEVATGPPADARRRWWPEVGLGLGVTVAAQFLIDPEVLAQCLLLAGGALLVGALAHRRALRERLGGYLTAAGTALSVTAALVGYPLYQLLAGAGHLRGPVQPVAKLQFFSEDLLEPLLPTLRQAVDPAAGLAHFATRDLSELGGYLGLPLLLLVLVCLLRRFGDPLVRCGALLGGAAFVLALGPRLVVHGHRSALALPEVLLSHLPLLDNLVPARFGGEVALFSAAVVALGLGRGPLPARRGARLGLLGLGALTLATLVPALPLAESALAWPAGLPAPLTAALARDAVVLAYPYPTPPDIEAMGWQAEDAFSFRLLGGYATVRGPGGKGQYWPLLLEPAGVQRFLAATTAGAASHYPRAAPRPSTAAFCRYLRGARVTDVLDWPHGVDPAPVRALFRAALGPPRLTAGGVALYSARRCRAR